MRLSIATRVFIGFAAVLACGAGVSLYGAARLHRIGQGLALVSKSYVPLTRALSTLEAFQKERERSTERLLEEADPAARRNLVDLDRTYFARVVGERLGYAQQLVSRAEGDRESLDRLGQRLISLAARVEDEESASRALTRDLRALPAGKPSERPELQAGVARLRTAQRRASYELRTLSQVLQDSMNRGIDEAERQERESRWAVLGLAALALLVGLFVTWISQRALAPIRGLTEAAQRLGRGSPDLVVVPEQGGDELALLAREFNAMAQRLVARERELRAQGEALVRSERLAAIGRIAAQITHEIRNPLSSISLNADELEERVQTSAPDALPLCRAIVREVDRLTAVTEEYLRFARLPKPQLARIDLNDAVVDLLDFVAAELEGAGVRVARQLSPALPPVLADVGQLRQLLLNLVRNAREAMPSGGTLSILTRAEPADGPASAVPASAKAASAVPASAKAASAVIEVRDTGGGIPPERLSRIFDPFFTTKERGTGLGLAVAQEVAQEHGGQLTCDSQPGQGTRFELRLPFAPAQEEAPRAAAVAERSTRPYPAPPA